MSDDELALELEALAYSYPGDELRAFPASAGSGVTCIELRVVPRTGDDLHHRFAEALITLKPGPGYPGTPPTILVQTQGLGDAREAALLALLQHEATELAGELVLSHLCETAAEYVSANNFPDGDCAFCLSAMHHSTQQQRGQVGEEEEPQQLLKLPACYHVFHQ